MYRLFLIFFCLFISSTAGSQQLAVTGLTCEYSTNPAGIESMSPRLSWVLQTAPRNTLATAYRVIVASDPQFLGRDSGDVWDSKKVSSSESILVPFAGKKLKAATTYHWKVMVWDNHGNSSKWSAIARWQMGLLQPQDWKQANWIAYEKIADSNVSVLPVDGKKDSYKGNNILPLLRKNFTINKPVKKATMFICGLGHFELYINGNKAGNHFLDPGWTKYDHQALYVPFDITTSLVKGNNAIGIMLGNGFYYIPPVSNRYRKTKTAFGYPKMIGRLLIEYADGSTQDIVSDASWKTSKSPIVFSSIYGGEDYDARLEQYNWDRPGFKDHNWKKPILVDGPAQLNAQLAEPLKLMETFVPVKTSILPNGDHVFDLGQNASGIPFIKLQGKKGDTVRIIPAELLNADGSANQKASGKPFYFTYVLKGDGIETWKPRFTYYGFRYLQVNGAVTKGAPNPNSLPVLHDIKGLHVRNAAPVTGHFTSSNELFNRSYDLINWAIKSNMVSLFTDCPHREKLGWLEESHLMGNSIQYNYDIATLGRKQADDMIFSQTADGLIPEIAPEYVKFEWGGDMFRDSPEWGSNGIIMPWYLYKWYGDLALLEKTYPMMLRYIDYLKTKLNGKLLKQGLGDWYDIGPNPPGVSQLTPMGVTGTAMFFYDLNIVSTIAKMLNKPTDAVQYEQLAGEIKQAFNDSFFNKQTMQYATGSQTANAMAIFMGLVDPEYKGAVMENLVNEIRSRNNSLTAGDIGYRYLLKVLQQEGRSDIIFDMNSRSDVPGYGYQLAKGATALTESWQAYEGASNNHLMLGHLMEWFYEGLAGISQAEGSIAYKNIVINPQPVGDITSASASYKSMYGVIKSEWKKEATNFKLKVFIPANTTAVVYLPADSENKISESNKPLREQPGIKLKGFEKGRAIIEIGSGDYEFNSE